jgi:hypothetical protein
MAKKTESDNRDPRWPTAGCLPLPAKTLVTAVIVVMGIALGGALCQIVIHDIIPTFFDSTGGEYGSHGPAEKGPAAEVADHGGGTLPAGDLFGGDIAVREATSPPFYKEEQFVWTMKWTHIHLFGMSMIFIFMGGIALLLEIDGTVKSWVVALPFAGVLIDIGAMWLKGYVSPAFFWLHIPGGGLFGGAFLFVSLKALLEMWGPKNIRTGTQLTEQPGKKR